MVSIFHQLGFNYGWSLESIKQDRTGDGVIVGGKHMEQNEIALLAPELRRASFFDPQCFIPNTAKGKLKTYDFFPDKVAKGFTTAAYDSKKARRSAELCLQLQLSSQFGYCVIPTRYYSGMPSDFLENQIEQFVEPFLLSYDAAQTECPLLLQLALNADMIKDKQFTARILNWVTGIGNLRGVYLATYVPRRRKQIDDIDFLTGLLDFVCSLRTNDLEVFLGYQNTESLITLVADPTGVSMGSYENLRMFRPLLDFGPDEGHKHNPPVPRIYVPRLLQWIDTNYIGSIMKVVKDPRQFFQTSSYNEMMFTPDPKWNFRRPELYKHYFAIHARHLRELGVLPPADRFRMILETCKRAYAEHERLEELGILLGEESGRYHLPSWITALNMFGKSRGYLS